MRLGYGRGGALCGVVFVLALWIGNQMAIAGEGPMNSPQSVLAGLQRPRTAGNMVGMALEVAGFAAFMFFVGYMRERPRRAGDWLATTAVIAAAVTVAIKVGSIAPEYAVRLHPHQISGALARGLFDLGGGAFVVSGLTFAVFVLAASLAGLSGSGKVMPRWLGWPGVEPAGAGHAGHGAHQSAELHSLAVARRVAVDAGAGDCVGCPRRCGNWRGA